MESYSKQPGLQRATVISYSYTARRQSIQGSLCARWRTSTWNYLNSLGVHSRTGASAWNSTACSGRPTVCPYIWRESGLRICTFWRFDHSILKVLFWKCMKAPWSDCTESGSPTISSVALELRTYSRWCIAITDRFIRNIASSFFITNSKTECAMGTRLISSRTLVSHCALDMAASLRFCSSVIKVWCNPRAEPADQKNYIIFL